MHPLEARTNAIDSRRLGQRLSHMNAMTAQQTVMSTLTARAVSDEGPTGVHNVNIGTAPRARTTAAIIRRVKPRRFRYPR
jgi:hypothetical protein